MDLAKELQERGLVEHTSAPLEAILSKKRTAYLGVDPSADSMQAGNLVVILLMRRLAEAGHRIVLLVGGGTGMIGDPRESGERPLADTKLVERNKKALKAQMQRIVGTKVTLVDNADWLLKERLVDFLRDVGKHFTVNELIKRDIIKRRLEDPDDSISYTEFAYSLLQGYDYYVLNRDRAVDLQVGGTDQWTNLLSGVELIRKKSGKEAFTFTVPLVTDSAGKKFGKSEGNAIWLSAEKTSPYTFYQFWRNQPDEMVEKYLKMYTFLSLDEIASCIKKHQENPANRYAQDILARAVTELVHGHAAVETAQQVTSVLFSKGSLSELSAAAKRTLMKEAPSAIVRSGESIVDALVATGLASSKAEARRLVEAQAIVLGEAPIHDPHFLLQKEQFINGLALLRKGKREVAVLVLK